MRRWSNPWKTSAIILNPNIKHIRMPVKGHSFFDLMTLLGLHVIIILNKNKEKKVII